jgi:group I intron endonuclease
MSDPQGKKSGIYQITNIITRKIYIGSTKNYFKNRWWSHKNDLKNKNHCNQYLQRAWDKYGETSFIFSVLEENVPYEKLHEREQYWIDKTNCTNFEIGYNLNKKADRPNPREYTVEQRIDQSLRMSNGGYLVIYPSGLEVYVPNLSLFVEANPEFELTHSCLTSCARGEQPHHKGFKCKFANPEYQVEYIKSEDNRLREFILFDPQGKRYEVNNLSEFCRQHNIEDQRTTLLGCAKGKNYQSKGWQCYYEENAPKEFIPVEELQAQNRKHYFIISPDYQTYTTDYLREFCEEHNLNEHAMRCCANPKEKAQRYKNWECYEDNENLNKQEILDNLPYYYVKHIETGEQDLIPQPLFKEWSKEKGFTHEYVLRVGSTNHKKPYKKQTHFKWYIKKVITPFDTISTQY